jgi:hypothetical protein
VRPCGFPLGLMEKWRGGGSGIGAGWSARHQASGSVGSATAWIWAFGAMYPASWRHPGCLRRRGRSRAVRRGPAGVAPDGC